MRNKGAQLIKTMDIHPCIKPYIIRAIKETHQKPMGMYGVGLLELLLLLPMANMIRPPSYILIDL